MWMKLGVGKEEGEVWRCVCIKFISESILPPVLKSNLSGIWGVTSQRIYGEDE